MFISTWEQSLRVYRYTKRFGNLISNDLKFEFHTLEACKNANKMLGMIKRTVVHKDPRILVSLYKSLVRPHLEYCCSAWEPHYQKDKDRLQKVQHCFSRMLQGMKELEYPERLKRLGLWTLEERRNHADLIEVFNSTNHPKRRVD